MKRLLLATLIAGASLQAHALGDLADVTIVDRDTGQILPVHAHRGEYWVAGRPGARYAIRIRNQVAERLLAITAVDGVNIITGDTAGFSQSGYVYAPWQSYELTGWRKSDTQIAAFEFTAEPNSYASRTGRPANVGVIGVALFREQQPEEVRPALERDSRTQGEDAAQKSANAAAPPSSKSRADSGVELGRLSAQPKLGTGHGAREESVVEQTSFERMQETPNEVIRIRYDSRVNLLAMGVIHEPRRRYNAVSPPEPFPGSPVAGYVPDPPG